MIIFEWNNSLIFLTYTHVKMISLNDLQESGP